MKIQASIKEFSEIISEASRFLSNKPSNPVMTGMFLQTQEDSLLIRTGNGQAMYQCSLPVTVLEKGECIVSGSTFLSVIKALESGTLELETQLEQIVVRQAGVTFEVSLLAFTEFPGFLETGEEKKYHLATETFVQASKQVMIASSADETKPVLTSLALELHQPNALVATDGFRLYRLEIDLAFNEDGRLLLPAKSLRETLALLEKSGQSVVDSFWNNEKTHLTFTWDQKKVQFSMVQGDFPEYQAIIPQACAFSYSVDRELLSQRVKQAMIFAKDVSSIVIFSVENNELLLDSQTSVRGKTKTRLPAHNLEGEVARFGCNGKYVLEFLSSIDSPEITIRGNESLKPVIFGVPGEDTRLYLVMPFKLQE